MVENQSSKTMNEKDIEIELVILLRALWKHAWIIFIAGILGGCMTYLGTKQFIAPIYQSGFTAYVNNRSGGTSDEVSSLNSSDLQASQALVETYAKILSSRSVLVHAAEEAGLDYGYEKLKEMAVIDIVGDTEIISIQVTAENPEEALHLAQAIAEITPEKIASIVEGSSMKIIDEPVLAQKSSGPGFAKYTILGILAGVLLSCVILILLELLDDRVKNENELEERMKIRVLGTIPDLVQSDKNSYEYGYGYTQKMKSKGEQS